MVLSGLNSFYYLDYNRIWFLGIFMFYKIKLGKGIKYVNCDNFVYELWRIFEYFFLEKLDVIILNLFGWFLVYLKWCDFNRKYLIWK